MGVIATEKTVRFTRGKTASGSKTELVGGHAFALHSYDKATDTFLISNPWTESSAGILL